MTVLRACVKCGRPSRDGYCSQHRPKPWSTSQRRQRMGLSGGAWATLREQVLARDMGCCYLCDKLGADQVDHLGRSSETASETTSNRVSVRSTVKSPPRSGLYAR